ncbi:MAG: 3-hydroxybutyrate dehydrogenase [Roseovarius sp.]|nr:3-hydroxybutyrate dehydrogenase [Roseovarius sp.]
MTDLRGKTALVTGSVQGIGLEIAKSLASAGAKMAVHGIATESRMRETCGLLREAGAEDASWFYGDLRHSDQIVEMMKAVSKWGGVDILVNNAGIQHTASLKDMPHGKWEEIISVNLSASFYTMQAALPLMAEQGYGRVVNIASVQGLIGSLNKGPYVAAKHGLVGLSKVAALEYATAGKRHMGNVTVNCICPGWTETSLIEPQINQRAIEKNLVRDDAISDLLAEKQPSLRMSSPGEIGAIALWLCDPVTHNITGIQIPVDGGWTAQ